MGIQQTDTNWETTMFATTSETYAPVMQDNVSQAVPVLDFIKSKSKVQIEDGGAGFVVTVMVGKNATAQSFSGYDSVSPSAQKGILNAKMDWASYTVTLLQSHEEKMRNTGKGAFIDLMKAKILQGEMSLIDLLASELWIATQSGSSLTPFADMIPLSATPGTYMGLSHAQWAAKYETCAATELAKGMSKIYRKVKDGANKPNVIFTSDNGEALYESVISSGGDSNFRIAIDANKADLGLASFLYRNVPIIADKYVPDNDSNAETPNFWFLNTENIGFKFKGLKMTPWTDSIVYPDGRSAYIVADVQLMCNNRRREGVLKIAE